MPAPLEGQLPPENSACGITVKGTMVPVIMVQPGTQVLREIGEAS